MAKKKVTREELNTLAAEVNAVLNLENPIKFGKKITDDELVDAIVKQCKNDVYEIDFIEDEEDPNIPVYSEEMRDVFNSLGIKIKKGSPMTPVEDAEEDDAEVEEIKPAKKGAAKKDVPVKEVVKAAPASAKKAKKIYTRYNSFADVVKSGKKMSVADIAIKANDFYVKNGKKSKVNESKRVIDLCIKIAVALDHGKFEKEYFTYIP